MEASFLLASNCCLSMAGTEGKDAFMFQPEVSRLKAFQHKCRKVWFLRIPVPFLGMSADGYTVFHQDGKGWFVLVDTKSEYVGKLVSYKGHVRLVY